ncbi:GNAT family N-acetyltransferase [Microbacteriaceae bacterium VKM Ac-2854]|nr:GNAT family N-acetyltransferase [Microbacteriaceae bacterium VKM Ac-2854]
MRIESVAWEHPEAERLRAAQRVEIDGRYGADTEPGEKPTAASVSVFLVAFDDAGTGLGCGGLRMLEPGIAEIKRMYVAPSARGSGVSTALLRRLEAEAASAGVTQLRLETGPAQPDAVRFYTREGYTRIPNFGYYVDAPDSLCFGRVLG